VPFLLAQLVAPPLQNSPVRLPTPALEQPQRRPSQPAAPILEAPIEASPPDQPPPTLQPTGPVDPRRLPAVQGKVPYTPQQLAAILQPCSVISPEAEKLRACAAALTSRLVLDGYVNTRVFVFADPPPAYLQVVQGKVVELRVQGPDPRLNVKVRRWLGSILGTTLHLPSLERTLQLLQRRPEVDSVRSQLTRLGGDPSQAVLVVKVISTPPLLGRVTSVCATTAASAAAKLAAPPPSCVHPCCARETACSFLANWIAATPRSWVRPPAP